MAETVDILIKVTDQASAQIRHIEAAMTSLRRQAAQGLPALAAPPRVSLPPVVSAARRARFPVSTVLPRYRSRTQIGPGGHGDHLP